MSLDPIAAASTREAVIAVLMLAMVSDRRVRPLEDEVLHAALKRSRTLAGLSEKDLRALEARVASALAETTLASAASRIPEDLRLPLFAQAIDILLADGELTEAEADFVNGLIMHLNIDRNAVESIADVLAIKNRL
jgi:uncharacterized tellurite resistance protein B-like protein